MNQVHEFMAAAFRPEIEADQQLAIMEALDHHLRRCEGLVSREYFRGEDARWIEHTVWASQADLESSACLAEDPVAAWLYDCFDTRSISYLRGERVEPGGISLRCPR
jgi:hypothetical protein